MLPIHWKFKEVNYDNKPTLILEYNNHKNIIYYSFQMQKLKELKIGDKIINKKSGISCIIIKVNEKTIIGKTGRFEITLTISEFIKDWKKN
jgi:hypothetical protein